MTDVLHRKAGIEDIGAIVALGVDALTKLPAPNQVISKQRIAALAEECISRPFNYAWVVEKDGEVVGALCAIVADQMVYERKAASVVQYWCQEPGAGIEMIRRFLDWARPQMKIKSIQFTLECGADPRIILLLERLGLRKQEIPVIVEWR
jgi:hypothetical protein